MSEAAFRTIALPRGSLNGKRLVLWSVALLVVIRFFTEVVGVLPGAAKLVDVPIAIVLVTAAATRGAAGPALAARGYLVPSVLFFGVAVASVLANLSRVAPGPTILFLYGFLGPVVVYHAAYRLWPTGNARAMSRLFIALGVLQLVVVATVDLPRFISSRNPDEISGTFGENPYQLVFFLLVFCAVVAATAVYEPKRTTAWLAPLLIVCALGAIFLAQYRALLVAAVVTLLVLGALLLRGGARGGGVALFVLVAFAAALAIVTVRFPTTKYQPYLTQIKQSPLALVRERIHALGGVVDMYNAYPGTVPAGSGPGTFSSRAWETFSTFETNRARTNPVTELVIRITGGHYATDVSDRFSKQRYLQAQVVLGSRAVTTPFSSYTSLLAEVGVVGFLLMVGMYVAACGGAIRKASRAARRWPRGEPVVALLVGAAVAFVVLLQMAFLGNWLEVTRITMPAWLLLAVAVKEFRARVAAEER